MGKEELELRDAVEADAHYLAPMLREADVREAWAALMLEPTPALLLSLRESELAFTALYRGKPGALFGVVNETQLWMMASAEMGLHPRPFLRMARVAVDVLLKHYPLLFNMVDARHLESIRLLRFLGAELSPARAYGPLQLPFHRFELRRQSCA